MIVESKIGKKEFINELSTRCEMTKVEATKAYENVFKVLHQLIVEGNEEILISEIGKFKIKIQDEKIARNPSNGKTVVVPPKKVLSFKISNAIKKEVAPL